MSNTFRPARRSAAAPEEARFARRAEWTVRSEIGTQEWSARRLRSGGWAVSLVESIDGGSTTEFVEERIWSDADVDSRADRFA